MDVKFSAAIIAVISLSVAPISNAGLFDTWEKIKDTSGELIDSASDNIEEVGNFITDNIPTNHESNNPEPEITAPPPKTAESPQVESNKTDTARSPTPTTPQTDIIEVGTVEGHLTGITKGNVTYRLMRDPNRRNRRLYCNMTYINASPSPDDNIPVHFINSDGARENSRVQFRNVIKKGGKCYFESVHLLEKKEDKRITLLNIRTIGDYGSGGSHLRIERDNIKLVKELAQCRSGSFQRRISAKNQYPRAPYIKKGSVINMYGVSLQGSNCTFERIEIVQSPEEKKPVQVQETEFKPDPAGKYKGEGNFLAGTLNQDIKLAPFTATDRRGVKKQGHSIMFSLSNRVKPAAKPTSCRYYQEDKIISNTYQQEKRLKYYRERAAGNSTVVLTNVRPSDKPGTCLFASMSVNGDSTITQSMVSTTTAAQQSYRDAIYQYCQSNSTRIKRVYRCGCLADKQLQAAKLNLTTMETEPPLIVVKNECANTAEFSRWEYSQCIVQYKSRNKLDQNAIDQCQCQARRVEHYAKELGLADSSTERTVKSAAVAYCRDR